MTHYIIDNFCCQAIFGLIRKAKCAAAGPSTEEFLECYLVARRFRTEMTQWTPIVSVSCEDVTLLRMPVNLIDAGDANSFAVPSRQDEDYGLKKLEWAKKDG
jgi:hypothetical protein